MKRFHKTASAVAVVALFSLFSATSNATIISSGSNNPLVFAWSYNAGVGLLTGSGAMTLSGFNSSALTVNVTLNNTSSLASERLTAFGFGINPDATGLTFSDVPDAGMVDASLAAIPSLSTIEVCAWGGQNCSGGSNGGILGGGSSDSFAIVLAGTWGSSVDIAPIGFKYQTDFGSFEFDSGDGGGGGGGGGGSIPEPGSLLLLGAGLVGLGLARRRKAA